MDRRYVTLATQWRITKALRLPEPTGMQDWPIEVAASERIDEFIAYYTHPENNDDDRFAIMRLIVASFDIADDGTMVRVWPEIRALLRRDRELHRSTIEYWACWDAADSGAGDDLFPASLYIRSLDEPET